MPLSPSLDSPGILCRTVEDLAYAFGAIDQGKPLAGRARDMAGLRIGVKKGGCAGMEYTMDYVADVNPTDEVVEKDGARVMIAPMAQMFLFGTEIDYETSLLESTFRFNNPNVAEACGCGESIKFKDQPAA